MAALEIGTREGAYRLEEGTLAREGGPGAVRFLAASEETIYALDGENGLWRREPSGWQRVNGRCVDDDVWSFAADARISGRLYLGVSPALLYRSDDGGTSWTACDSVKRIPGYETWTFPPPPHIPHVRSIAPDPEVPGGVYIGVEEGGVYRSPNGGDTWEGLNEGLYWDVHTVTPTPGGARLYATTGGGFYRSDDGGCSWRHITAGLDRRYTVTFAATPEPVGRVYVAAAAGPPPTWRNGADAALYRSDDCGETWTRLEDGLPDRFDRMVGALVTDANGSVFAATSGLLFASGDGGDSWRLLADGLPPISALILA